MRSWEALTTDHERMTGRFALVVRASRLQGSARVDCDLRVFGKTSTTPFASKSRAGDRHSGQHERWREVKERWFAR